MSTLLLLIRKDLLTELRGREMLSVLFLFTLLFAGILGSGVSLASLQPSVRERLFPSLLWALLLISATVGTERSMDKEFEFGAFDVLLTGVRSPEYIYTAKVIASTFLVTCSFIFGAICLAVFMNIDLVQIASSLLMLAAFVSFGYSSLSVLLVMITVRAGLKGFLFPLIFLPLLFPLFFSGIVLTQEVFDTGSLPFSAPYLSFLFGLDVLYSTLR